MSLSLIATTIATQDSRPTTIVLPYRLYHYSEPFHSISMRLVVLRPLEQSLGVLPAYREDCRYNTKPHSRAPPPCEISSTFRVWAKSRKRVGGDAT